MFAFLCTAAGSWLESGSQLVPLGMAALPVVPGGRAAADAFRAKERARRPRARRDPLGTIDALSLEPYRSEPAPPSGAGAMTTTLPAMDPRTDAAAEAEDSDSDPPMLQVMMTFERQGGALVPVRRQADGTVVRMTPEEIQEAMGHMQRSLPHGGQPAPAPPRATASGERPAQGAGLAGPTGGTDGRRASQAAGGKQGGRTVKPPPPIFHQPLRVKQPPPDPFLDQREAAMHSWRVGPALAARQPLAPPPRCAQHPGAAAARPRGGADQAAAESGDSLPCPGERAAALRPDDRSPSVSTNSDVDPRGAAGEPAQDREPQPGAADRVPQWDYVHQQWDDAPSPAMTRAGSPPPDHTSLDEFVAQSRENAESVAGDAVSQTDGVGP